jgi:hypothetical protein
MFNAAKDTMTSRAAQFYVNSQIARYGEVQKLKIDSRQKTVEVSCLLHGEPSPISIKVENYKVETAGDKKFFQATDISCTRPWLQNLLSDFAKNRRVELPGWADGVL